MGVPDRPSRVIPIDALRGGVMIVMALDHVRDFIHRAAMVSSPTDLAQTTPILFFTRWVTHICAPVFMFTAGMGAFLWWRQRRPKRELSTFLLTRGLWLIVLELTVMRVAYDFDASLRDPVLLLVLWVLGACMIALAALIWLPTRALAAASILIIVLHNLLDRIRPAQFGGAAWIWNLIHAPGAFSVGGVLVIVGYPLVPWIAVITLGFISGHLFLMDTAVRQRRLIIGGAVLTIAFVAIRALNRYGDPAPWSARQTGVFTMLSFLNTTKYPPSLAFLLMTLGPALLLLAALDRSALKSTNPIVVFGRVPLFYFVCHFFAAHVVAALLAVWRYGRAAFVFMNHPVPSMGGPAGLFPPAFGYDLWVVYAVWALIVLALYPACRWFARVKASRDSWWLRYV